MTLFFNFCWVRRKEVKPKKLIIYLFSVFLFLSRFFFIILKILAKTQTVIKVILNLSTVNGYGKRNILFLLKSIWNHISYDLKGVVFTELKQDNGDISILVQNQIEFELRVSRMNLIQRDKGSCSCKCLCEKEWQYC